MNNIHGTVIKDDNVLSRLRLSVDDFRKNNIMFLYGLNDIYSKIGGMSDELDKKYGLYSNKFDNNLSNLWTFVKTIKSSVEDWLKVSKAESTLVRKD